MITFNAPLHHLVRYLLGTTLITYGVIKIFQIQFALPPEMHGYRLADMDGVTLAWAFMGHSWWFSALLGFFELTAGVLLLFRRTVMLGALLAFPSLLAVVLVNNAYDFLPHMRVFTGILLLANTFLLIPGSGILTDFVRSTLVEAPFKLTEIIVNVSIIVGSVVLWIVFGLN
jgi:hypothetical protein